MSKRVGYLENVKEADSCGTPWLSFNSRGGIGWRQFSREESDCRGVGLSFRSEGQSVKESKTHEDDIQISKSRKEVLMQRGG